MSQLPDWRPWLLAKTGAQDILTVALVQELWHGYGELLRVTLRDGPVDSVILKRVTPPREAQQTASDSRKRRSYVVERAWYEDGSKRCDMNCRVARCYATEQLEDGALLLLEDLVAEGYRPNPWPESIHTEAGLRWLARFHSRFLDDIPIGLWEQGCYWHLDTRQEELERMPAGPLKDAAALLDSRLKGAHYQTLCHGDAKTTNFLWNEQGGAAAVDFQYVGRGCGIRDVALFLDRALGREGCDASARRWLETYFGMLRIAMAEDGHAELYDSVRREWQALFPVAWSDYNRFRLGWGRPGPLDSFSESQLQLALD